MAPSLSASTQMVGILPGSGLARGRNEIILAACNGLVDSGYLVRVGEIYNLMIFLAQHRGKTQGADALPSWNTTVLLLPERAPPPPVGNSVVPNFLDNLYEKHSRQVSNHKTSSVMKSTAFLMNFVGRPLRCRGVVHEKAKRIFVCQNSKAQPVFAYPFRCNSNSNSDGKRRTYYANGHRSGAFVPC